MEIFILKLMSIEQKSDRTVYATHEIIKFAHSYNKNKNVQNTFKR